jgi:predicted nucleic acid-binding protein
VKCESDKLLTKTGRLRKAFTPAVYFDTSVLVDYWSAEGLEWADKESLPPNDLTAFLRELLRTDKRISEGYKIRKAILMERPRVFSVTSSLATLELVEWYAYVNFKQVATEAAGATAVQSKSRKEIGDLLKRLTDLARDGRRRNSGQIQSSPVEHLSRATWLNPSFSDSHGLAGIVEVDLVNFNFTLWNVWDKACLLAYHQVGMADTLHILAAYHLGCEYFASFDSDFKRIREILEDAYGITLLSSAQELLQTLSR